MPNGKLLHKISKLTAILDRKLVLRLFWIRLASMSYSPYTSQISLWDTSTDNVTLTPWDLVVRKDGGSYHHAITRALRMLGQALNSDESFLIEDEAVVLQLVDALSYLDIRNETDSPSTAYQNFLRREYKKSATLYGDFYTPENIAQLMITLLEPQGGKVYDPCCGSGALLIAAAHRLNQTLGFSLYGQTLSDQTLQICKMNLYLRNVQGNLGNSGTNTLVNDQFPFKTFDYILSNPPFNFSDRRENSWRYDDPRWIYGVPPNSNANFAWLQHIIYHLSNSGRASVLMPNSTLTSNNRHDAQIRKGIIDAGILESIITFPKNIFYTTEIPFCLWLINKEAHPHNNVLFIDATRLEPKIHKRLLPIHEDTILNLLTTHRKDALSGKDSVYAVAAKEDIALHEYTLSPNLYLKSVFQITIKENPSILAQQVKAVQASDISKELFCNLEQWGAPFTLAQWSKRYLLELYDTSTGIVKRKDSFGHGFPMLDTKTVVGYHFVPSTLYAKVDVSNAELSKYGVCAGDVFLNRTSESSNELASCCVAAKDVQAVYGSFLKRLRPRIAGIIYPYYAAGYFRSPVFRKEIADTSTVYTTRASLNNKSLSKVSFYYPNWETQCKIGDTLYALFLEIEHCQNLEQRLFLEKLRSTLIEQVISYPIIQTFDVEDV